MVGKDLGVLENMTFKSLDYIYLTGAGEPTVSYIQVSFEAAANTRSEKFTLILTPKGDSYYVIKVSHIIPKDHVKHEREEHL